MTQRPDSIRVLLADRHALFREAMRAVLESEAEIHVVAEARDGLEAVSEAERSLPHVAILDVDLPMSDGARTTATIKARVPECQVLVLSAREDYRSLIEVLDAGASGYITRESPLAELIQATRAVHHGDTLVPPGMLGPLLSDLLRRKRDQDRGFDRSVPGDQPADRQDAHPEHLGQARGAFATGSCGFRHAERSPRQPSEVGRHACRRRGHQRGASLAVEPRARSSVLLR